MTVPSASGIALAGESFTQCRHVLSRVIARMLRRGACKANRWGLHGADASFVSRCRTIEAGRDHAQPHWTRDGAWHLHGVYHTGATTVDGGRSARRSDAHLPHG